MIELEVRDPEAEAKQRAARNCTARLPVGGRRTIIRRA